MKLEKNQRRIIGFDGIERIYTFDPLSVQTAIDVEDTLWRLVARLAANAGTGAAALFNQISKEGLSSADIVAGLSVPDSILRSIPRVDLKELAETLLSGAVVDGPEVYTLSDGWTDEYFRGRWPERIDAILQAINVSFPGYFSMARAYLKDLFEKRLGMISSATKKDVSQIK